MEEKEKMIFLSIENGTMYVTSNAGELTSGTENQLDYWDYKSNDGSKWSNTTVKNATEHAVKLVQHFDKRSIPYEVNSSFKELLDQNKFAKYALEESLKHGAELKAGNLRDPETLEFHKFLDKNIARKLKDHQIKAALHLLSVKNGANFSVPGSGKTTVVLSVYHMLRQQNIVDALFVVGPPSCFTPWQEEFKETIGVAPKYEIFAGGNIEDRHSRYLTDIASACDLYLTSYQTLCRDSNEVQELFSRRGIRFFYVIDEAHYIKQIEGQWASAVLQISRFAERRCILTGTPFPKNHSDAFNLFDVLWPESSPISPQEKHLIVNHTRREEYESASNILRESIDPLFYRVRKLELNLAPQKFLDPVLIPMNVHEKRVYDTILDRIEIASQSDYLRDLDLAIRLRRGRMMRLRQCLSYTKLLTSAIEEYSEELFEDDSSLTKSIHDYDKLETPGKIEILVKIVNRLKGKGEKIVIWSNFIGTLELIKETLSNLGYGVRLIYGATPTERQEGEDSENTREAYIREFKIKNSGVDILVANPAACAESISLHKACSNAIYYDLSYNCAQYLQSLDRIHRVGGSENKISYYHFLQYRDTIDQNILQILNDRAERMSEVIDRDYEIYSLDMFEQDDDAALYEKLFDHE